MKKIISTVILVTIMTAVAIAQNNNASFTDEKTPASNFNKKLSGSVSAQLKAEKDFLRSNKQAENIRWYDDANGFFVYYTKDGNKGRSFYSKKGKFIYNVLSYPEQFLPGEIRNRIKSVYYMDYQITHVNEIRNPDKTVFLVHLTDDKTWKKIRIHEDEMEVVQEYTAK